MEVETIWWTRLFLGKYEESEEKRAKTEHFGDFKYVFSQTNKDGKLGQDIVEIFLPLYLQRLT